MLTLPSDAWVNADAFTNTHMGLATAQEEVTANGRAGIMKLVILITDGDATNKDLALQAATDLKASKVVLFAAAVGNEFVELNILQKQVTEPYDSHLKKSSSYEDLSQSLDTIINEACTFVTRITPGTACFPLGGDVDIVVEGQVRNKHIHSLRGVKTLIGRNRKTGVPAANRSDFLQIR
jgi:collagen type VI alpha